MKYDSFIRPRMVVGILCGMALATGAFTSSARADEWSKRTILTVSQPIQVTDTVLQPGQYVLRLLDSQSERHVVQIFNRNQTHIIDTVIAVPTQRMEPTGRSYFTFWETPPGTDRALRDWYYPGDTIGSEFPYPKHLQQVAMVTHTEMAAAEAPPAPAEPAPATEPQAEQPAEQPAPEQSAPEQPAETAQNTAPPPPATPNETPAQSTPNEPAQLPKTGSPYPAFGLAGTFLIGLGGLLRIKRHA